MVTKKPATQTPIEAVRHADKRLNNPTEELRDFVAEDEAAPATLLYPRDASLDPQLVWKGKDEQDREDLAVPVVPIYIQEKIDPRAIVESVRAEATKGAPRQASLFATGFDDLPFEDLIEFYQHEQNWANRLILGDSLLVMTSLAEKEGLKGQVQMIYIDPPYGIRFGSNWQVSTRSRDVKDGNLADLTRQPEQIRAFRDTWGKGINSYLAYLRDRLVVARDLLADSGSIFVQIGDDNLHLVRALLDEVFGRENSCGTIAFAKTVGATSELLPGTLDFVIWYSKDRKRVKYRQIFRNKGADTDGYGSYTHVELPDGTRRRLSQVERSGDQPLAKGARLFYVGDLTSARVRESRSGYFPVNFRGRTFLPNKREWSTNPEGMERLIRADRIEFRADSIGIVRYTDDFPVIALTNSWPDTGTGSFTDSKVYVVQTGTKTVQRCLLMTTDPGDLVLDPTCGSGTTAYVAEQWGRRWITIDTSRVALALARTRLMAARFPYYLLADSPEGVRKEAEITGQVPPAYETRGDIKKGFVYKRVPHVTLKSIANNPDIKEGMTREEIDAAIARHAETELLYDQPYEDGKRVRVSGPFTVESLSPHRVLAADEERPESEREATQTEAAGDFATTILENLRKAGVQNTKRDERLTFDRLEPFAGEWLHAAGEYTDRHGLMRRVALSLGPEHGTVGPEQVKEAAKEALRGSGFDLLVVCGFAFDAHAGETAKEFAPEAAARPDSFAVSEETRQYGKLPVMLARMNPDLAMGDDLLKKTGAGNLFMVFGEPDIEVRRVGAVTPVRSGQNGSAGDAGQIVVEIRGVDVYDPTTGEVRSSTTDDIACWFIDTNYNEEAFFVRHAYFTGADEPYERLKRALRAEIDEGAWSALYSTTSRPFDPPQTGKIAVKVINHYGDEVLKVIAV